MARQGERQTDREREIDRRTDREADREADRGNRQTETTLKANPTVNKACGMWQGRARQGMAYV